MYTYILNTGATQMISPDNTRRDLIVQVHVNDVKLCNRCKRQNIAWLKSPKTGKFYPVNVYSKPLGESFIWVIKKDFHNCGVK